MMNSGTSLICPKCQEPIPVTLADFKVAGCVHCGNISKLNRNGQLDTVYSFQPANDEQQTPFKLERQLRYHKSIYTVKAVFVYHVKYKEWDTENSKWISNNGWIREWYAYDDQNQLLIVMRDTDNRFYIVSNPAPATRASSPYKKNAKELGQYQLWAFAGMDKEEVESKGYYEIYGHTRIECANENFQNAPIVQYELTKLLPTQAKRMVILEEVEKLKAAEDFKTTTFFRNVFGLALLAILTLLVFNLGMNEASMQNLQSSPYISFAARDASGVIDTALVSPRLAGTFFLIGDKNYRFKARCYMRETNQSADYSVNMVRREDAALVNDIALNFYTESGHDDEGYWEENLLEDQFKFQVDKTGKYQVFVAPDYENLQQFPKAGLEIQIEPASYPVFYLSIGSFFLLLWLIFQWQRENLVAFANLPHDTTFHDIYESFL